MILKKTYLVMAQMMLLTSSGPFSSSPPTAAHPNLPGALSVIVIGAGGTGEGVTGGGGSLVAVRL
jgi:hypothetical protein